jgi:hypothetical protein
MPSRVSWRYDATTQPWLRALFLAGAGLVYGVYVLVAVATLTFFVAVLWTGSTGLRLIVVLLALVGGPLSLLYLLPVIRDPDQRPTLRLEGMEPVLSLRAKLVVGVVGAVVLALAAVVDRRLPLALGVCGTLAGLAYLTAATRGEVAPESRTIRNRTREFDLSPIEGYRTRTLGPLTLVTFSVPAHPGRFGGVPSRLLVPSERHEAVTAALDTVVEATEGTESAGRDPNPAVRWVAAAIALGCVGTGAAAFLLVGPGIGWYVAAMGGLFAVVFAYIAREG